MSAPLRPLPTAWLLAAQGALFTLPARAQVPEGLAPPADAGGLISQALFLKLGFSFMVGLALGYAIKIAFRIALLVAGLVLFALLLLQYKGFIQVEWSALERVHDGWTQWLGAQAGAFFGFVGRNLTSAASLLAGLAVGLRL